MFVHASQSEIEKEQYVGGVGTDCVRFFLTQSDVYFGTDTPVLGNWGCGVERRTRTSSIESIQIQRKEQRKEQY